jgi:hypothetical protein
MTRSRSQVSIFVGKDFSKKREKKEKNNFMLSSIDCSASRYVRSQRPKTKTGGRELNLTSKVISHGFFGHFTKQPELNLSYSKYGNCGYVDTKNRVSNYKDYS